MEILVGGGIEINPERLTNLNVDVGDYIVINGIKPYDAANPTITGGDVLYSEAGSQVHFDTAYIKSFVIIVKATATSIGITGGYSIITTKL